MARIVEAAARRRAEILGCAERLFMARGYDSTTLADIAENAGLSRAALLHQFETKQALLEALAIRYASEATEAARDLIEDPTLDSFSRLNGFLARLRRTKIARASRLNATFAPLLRPGNARLYQAILVASRAVVQPVLTRLIVQGVEERCFDTPDPEKAAETMLVLLGAAREQIVAIGTASCPEEAEAAKAALADKLAYLGTVIDRILGLPEGSIELADDQSIAVIAANLRAA